MGQFVSDKNVVEHVDFEAHPFQNEDFDSWNATLTQTTISNPDFGYGLGTYGRGVYGIGLGAVVTEDIPQNWQSKNSTAYNAVSSIGWQSPGMVEASVPNKPSWQIEKQVSVDPGFAWGIGSWGTGLWGKGPGDETTTEVRPWAGNIRTTSPFTELQTIEHQERIGG